VIDKERGMKSKRVEHRVHSAPGAFRLLSPEEVDSLRQEMKASSQWMKDEIERHRLQCADSIALAHTAQLDAQLHDVPLPTHDKPIRDNQD
jgi:hypothetical protein